MGHKPSKLLRFIDFLAKNMRCENLELLTRIVTEFQAEPQSFSTVERMLQLGFPMVTILPETDSDVDVGGQEVEEAADLRHDCGGDELMDLHHALKHKIILHNWDWLLEMYADYCAGESTSLHKFLSLRRQAISVIPAAPCPSAAQTSSSEEDEVNLRDSAPRSPQDNNLERKKAWTLAAHHLVKITDMERDLLDVINTMHCAIERQKPWEKVFDVSKIVYPFDASKHPSIALALLRFWTRYGRAVWERKFWCRFPRHAAENEDRCARQRDASKAFESTVMVRLFNELGATFFVDMDKRSEPHHWWWYRGPLVDLVCIASAHDMKTCLEYQKTQARARFPVVPENGTYRTYLHRHDLSGSTSMWSKMVGAKHIAAAIKELKRTKSQPRPITAP